MYRSFCLVLLALIASVNGMYRIANGQNATIEDFPYQVSVRILNSHICGGSILSPRVILTAAHCINPSDPIYYYSIAYGSVYIDGGKRLEIDRIDRHEHYNCMTVENDVAIIHLAEDIEFGPNAQPIALASKSPDGGTDAVVSGWGLTGYLGQQSKILQKLNVQIDDHYVCKKKYEGVNKSITDDMLCAGVDGEMKSVCRTDSGGPLVALNELVGVVSWGMTCDNKGLKPDVYADVAYLRDWIVSKMNNK